MIVSTRTKLRYRIPSIKEGITRLFDIRGNMRDSFSVALTIKKNNNITIVSSRSFNIAAGKVNQEMANVGDKMRSHIIKRNDD
jgi:hypothetical protein